MLATSTPVSTRKPKKISPEVSEITRCYLSPAYFIETYCRIYDATALTWIPFELWDGQRRALDLLHNNRLTLALKARQLGLTWLVLGYALWLMIFRPASTILVFSKRDDEAVYILCERLKKMFEYLPEFLRIGLLEEKSNDHEWALSNGSNAKAFPTTGGDSYTASFVIVDEADLIPNLNAMLRAAKPTIDGGGRMTLISRANRDEPNSEFKQIYRAAQDPKSQSPWKTIFLPWWTRPSRTQEWYEQQKNEVLSRTGVLDDLYEQYPSTDAEALSPRSLDKRILSSWLNQCYSKVSIILGAKDSPSIPGLVMYKERSKFGRYVIGADPAEGNPTSDNSALTVLDCSNGEEVATLAGKFQPSTFASHIDVIGRYYRDAKVMVERNNHGHAVLLWLRDNSSLKVLVGHDNNPGWHTTSLSKALAYETASDSFRNSEIILHSFETLTELLSIEGSTLSAPEGLHDDRAMSMVLAIRARLVPGYTRLTHV